MDLNPTTGNTRRPRILPWILTACLLSATFAGYRVLHPGTDSPVQVVNATWQVSLQLTNDTATAQLRITGKVLQASARHPARIALFPRQAVFNRLLLDDRPLTPGITTNGYHADLITDGPFEITANLILKPATEQGVHSLRLPKPPGTASCIAVDSTQPWEVWIANGIGRIEGQPDTGTHGRLYPGTGPDVLITWQPPRPPAADTGVIRATPSTVWTVDDHFITADILLQLDRSESIRRHITLVLPPGAAAVAVSGPEVETYRLSDRTLDIFLQRVRRGSAPIQLAFTMPRPDSHLIACGFPEIPDARIEPGGYVAVVCRSTGILLEQDLAGLEAVSDLDVPPALLGLTRAKPLYLYRQTTRLPRLVFDLVVTRPFDLVETIVDQADVETLLGHGGETVTRVRYLVRNHRHQFMRLRLPNDARLLSAQVNHHEPNVGRDNGYLLLPLDKSIQTLGGLIPFPVEIAWCRQGPVPVAGSILRIDLPELAGIPVAMIRARVWCPEDLVIRQTRSSLRPVPAFQDQDRFGWPDLPAAVTGTLNPDDMPASAVRHALAFNYYTIGQDAYRADQLEAAESYLNRVTEFAPGTSWEQHARDLLGNIQAGRGEVKVPADRMERARIAEIQRGMATGNERLEARQEKLIDAGLQVIQTGDEDLGAALLEEAEQLGRQLEQRHGSRARQSALKQKFGGKLDEVRLQQDRNRELNAQLDSLKREASTIVATKPAGDSTPAPARTFAGALARAARSVNADFKKVKDLAFNAPAEPKSAISSRSKARRLNQQLAASTPAAPEAYGYADWQRPAPSLSVRNAELEQAVTVLEQAVKESLDDTVAQPVAETERADISGALRRDIAGKRQALQILSGSLAAPGATANDLPAEAELDQIGEWVTWNRSTFGDVDAAISRDLASLESSVQSARESLADVRNRRKPSDKVSIGVQGLLDTDSPVGEKALGRFLAHNYAGPAADLTVRNGWISVTNRAGLVHQLNDAIEAFKVNRGQVVPVAGTCYPTAILDRIPVLNQRFTGHTTQGTPYAILDEAEYRTFSTLVAASAGNPSHASRSVLVGSSNTVAGQSFKLTRNDADANFIQVDGTEISLPQNRYLAVRDADTIRILKAGALQDWQDATADASLEGSRGWTLTVPESGIVHRFEKVLLAADESPDIDLVL
ncbi:MAG: hypothetical protein A2498_00295 [Lentisphaerae bacterium RIFOXYC12_FULL_60_16]|nr:MAG: hypothetical protein A2498_00295 [Lentisphaerae bacterium RIFOXYC12_FULL_60_16]